MSKSPLILYDQERPPGLPTSEPLVSKIAGGSVATQCWRENLQALGIVGMHCRAGRTVARRSPALTELTRGSVLSPPCVWDPL